MKTTVLKIGDEVTRVSIKTKTKLKHHESNKMTYINSLIVFIITIIKETIFEQRDILPQKYPKIY